MKKGIAISLFIFILIIEAFAQTTLVMGYATGKNNKNQTTQTYLQSAHPQPEKLTAVEADCTVAVGEKKKLTYMVYPSDAVSVYRYKSSKTSVVRVSSDGTISGMKQGTAVVTVTASNGVSCKFNVTVCPYCAVHEDVTVFAHRGASGNYPPGNSIEAFTHAKELGANAIELDAQKSADGVIFVRHDPTVRYHGKKRALSGLAYEVITEADQNVCTLKEALSCIRRYGLTVEIELKVSGIEQETLDIVNACDMGDKVIYASFDIAVINKFKELDPNCVTAYIMNSSRVYAAIVKNPSAYSCDIVSIGYRLLSTSTVRDLHLGGKKVSVWTLNTSGKIGTAIAKGVDAVITDYPQLV